MKHHRIAASLVAFLVGVALFVCVGCSADSGSNSLPETPADTGVHIVTIDGAEEGQDRKIVYTVRAYLTADDLDTARSALLGDLTGKEFCQSEDTYGDSEDDSVMYLVLRLKSDRIASYREFLATVGTLNSFEMSSEDITLRFNDVSALLKTYESQRALYQQLLEEESAKDSPDIALVERYAAGIEACNKQINEYRSQVNTLTDASEYSTVYLTVTERYVEQLPTFGQELGSTISGGWNFLLSFLKFIVKAFVAILPTAVFAGIIVAAILVPLKLTKPKRMRKAAEKRAKREAELAARAAASAPAAPTDPNGSPEQPPVERFDSRTGKPL